MQGLEKGFSSNDRTYSIHDENQNMAKAYKLRGAKSVVRHNGFFYRFLRFIGLGVFAKKTYIERVGGEYVRDAQADLKLKEQS